MNNNNNINNCGWIGSTHIDNLKLTSNILEQHIAIGDINSSNYTSNISNILNNAIININVNSSNYTSNASNILNTNSSNYTNILRYDVNKWINEQIEPTIIPTVNLTHTYIYNSNASGEIRFITKNTPIYYENDNKQYITRITGSGELECFYKYTIAYPTVLGGWYGVMDSLRDSYAYQATNGAIVGEVQLAINDIYQKYFGLVATTGASISALSGGQLTKEGFAQTVIAASSVVKFTKFNQVAAILGLSTLSGIGIAYSFFNNIRYDNITNNLLNDIYNLNLVEYSNITQLEKDTAIENLKTDILTNLYNTGINLRKLNDFHGYINSNILSEQYISNLKCDYLNLNTGNITNINGITANELIANGKIKQNGILLDNTYLTSNHLYNLSYNYTVERQYPPKAYTTTTPETTTTLLNKLVYNQTLFLDIQAISYGSGFYEVYSSSTFDTSTTKDRLFNFNTSETTASPRWAISLYNSGTGNYQGDNSIDGSYFGDWVIIKLPKEILLSRYRIYQRSDFLTKAPAEWKFYGSKDGINFVEITEATQATRLSTYSGGYFEKSLNQSFNIMYQYFGIVINKILSTSGQSDLSFSELQLFGKEILNNSITSSIYATSNAVKNIIIYDTPVVCKHFAFYISITTPININSKTYYKYDIDLRQYTKLGYIEIGSQSGDSYRIFKLRACFGSMYFSTLVNGLPNVVYSDIFMSMKANPTPNLGAAGLNICSIGNINNPRLDIIPSNNLFFMRNGANSIDYITVVSTNVADVRCFIEDMIS
jgi:hypothetical protein